jgi:hypothetical protein
MVKDGLQLTHGSLLEAISPFIMSSYLDHINTANISLRDGGDAVMIDSFGATLEQMKNEFTNGYLSSNVSKSIIKGFTTDLTSGLPRGVTRENDTVTISYVNVPALDKNLFIKVSDQDINGNVLQTVYKRDDVDKTESINNVSEVVSERKYTPDNIKSLESNQVFVFGANTVGGHGGGTAGIAQRGKASSNYTALKKGEKGLWSEYGVVDKLMEGTIGKSFGIVTKAASVSGTKLKIGSKRSVTLARINESVEALVKTAKENPKLEFLVTKFGTNMAGFSIKEMKSLLSDKELSDNIILPREFEYRNEANTTNNAPLSMDGVVGVYNKIETIGSNKQWAGGFLFGPRMTNKEVRKYTFDMQSNEDVAYDDVAYDVSYENFDDVNAAFEDAFEYAKDIDVVIGDAQNASSIMLDDIDVSDYLPSEAEVVVEEVEPIAKSNRPVPNRATTEEQISYEEYEDFESENYMEGAALLQESLHAELELAAFNPKAEGVNGTLISYWDENIEGNSEIKAKFANNGIGTYDLMYDEFLSGIYPATADMTTEEVFIESLKCIL